MSQGSKYGQEGLMIGMEEAVESDGNNNTSFSNSSKRLHALPKSRRGHCAGARGFKLSSPDVRSCAKASTKNAGEKEHRRGCDSAVLC
jgi:hypothetical protein